MIFHLGEQNDLKYFHEYFDKYFHFMILFSLSKTAHCYNYKKKKKMKLWVFSITCSDIAIDLSICTMIFMINISFSILYS